MRRTTTILFAILFMGIVGAADVVASDDLPTTFSQCVVAGGQVRGDDDEITCRLVRSYDRRTYGTATTACGERVDIEIWDETRTGVVTYAFEPGRTIQLPEVADVLSGMFTATPTPLPSR